MGRSRIFFDALLPFYFKHRSELSGELKRVQEFERVPDERRNEHSSPRDHYLWRFEAIIAVQRFIFNTVDQSTCFLEAIFLFRVEVPKE